MLEVESMLILSIFREVLCGALVGACLGFGYFRLLRKWGEIKTLWKLRGAVWGWKDGLTNLNLAPGNPRYK